LSATLQPLLDAAEIKRLIQQAGSLDPQQARHSQRFNQFGDQAASALGSGMDFADRRPYQAGDDPRFIDWRASARSAHTLIRRYHSEINHPGCIVIDRRASMAFGTRKRLKATQAVRAGITLGAQIVHAGSALAMLLLDRHDFWQAPQPGLASLQRSAQLAARPCPPDDADAAVSWNRIGHGLISRLAQGSRLVLISDFATLQPSDLKLLRQLGKLFDCHAVHIVDAAEQRLPGSEALTLQWRQQRINLASRGESAQTLEQTLQQRQLQIKDWFGRAQCGYSLLRSDHSLQALRP